MICLTGTQCFKTKREPRFKNQISGENPKNWEELHPGWLSLGEELAGVEWPLPTLGTAPLAQGTPPLHGLFLPGPGATCRCCVSSQVQGLSFGTEFPWAQPQLPSCRPLTLALSCGSFCGKQIHKFKFFFSHPVHAAFVLFFFLPFNIVARSFPIRTYRLASFFVFVS